MLCQLVARANQTVASDHVTTEERFGWLSLQADIEPRKENSTNSIFRIQHSSEQDS